METFPLIQSPKTETKNIVISGTNFWNPGDDFVRDGVIRILKRLLKNYSLNLLFYNFNQDFYPQDKFSGIHNMVAAGDLDKYREFVDAIVVAGLSAGKEIKDLYHWIIKNNLMDRVYLIGAGYANTYVEEHICQEPEATVFRNARIITGRTQKKPSFITEHSLPYHHISCPAMLSVEEVKAVPAGKKIETIGFSIQLPHGVGVPNHTCDGAMYKLAAHTLLELFPRYNVEIIAHHKQEYFHFLNLVKDHEIPVFFSSFYQDLYDIYRRYDLVISTRLHACIYANSHGIPGIIINDTDRHTHCAQGFPHLYCVNSKEKLYQEIESICKQDLGQIATDNKTFKNKLMHKYLTVFAEPFGVFMPAAKKPRFDKLNAGCGLDYRKGFVNIDGNPDLPKVDHILDIKPGVLLDYFEPGSFNYVLAQDFLEHHFHWEAHRLLEDFHILLSNDGTLDIRLPNTEAIVMDPRRDITEKIVTLYGGQDIQQKWETNYPNIFRQSCPRYFCHKYGWTPDSMKAELLSVGFSSVEIIDEGWNMKIIASKKIKTPIREREQLPVHFFTIVLNGQPFIRHHIEVFKRLPFKWYWHIIEGVADLNHDTAWSVELGGRIDKQLHRNGLSNDGTTEYLDELARQYPQNVKIYRKPENIFWDGKLEMVNAPLANIAEECLLWQVDSDELWTAKQICTGRDMFIAEPNRTAAYYLDHFYVGDNLVTTTINTYGNNTSYEWLRTWRFKPGFRWATHEPPRLCMYSQNDEWMDIAKIEPFRHNETAEKKLIFQHYAYATEKQLAFKEIYYGYSNAVAQWQRLQQLTEFPVFLRDYFAWVKDNAQVNTIRSQNVEPLAWKDANEQWQFRSCQPALESQLARSAGPRKKILIVRSDAIGDFVLFSGVLKYYREYYKKASIYILTQDHIADLAQSCPYIDEAIGFNRTRIMKDSAYHQNILKQLRTREFDIAINPVYSREIVSDSLTLQSGATLTIASKGDNSNISEQEKQEYDKLYTKLLPASDTAMLEIERNVEFIGNLTQKHIDQPCLPKVWIEESDETAVEELLRDLNVTNPIVICPVSQNIVKNWPLQKWIQLIPRYGKYPIIFCGSQEDAFHVNEVIKALTHNQVHSLCGKLTLRQTAALLKRSRLCLGVDTGPIHIAAAVGCPQVVITSGAQFGRFVPYSPDTTMVYLPMKCYHCNWRCKYDQARCVTQIRVDTVDRAVRQALDGSNTVRSKPILIEEILKSDLIPTKPIEANVERFPNPGKVENVTGGRSVEKDCSDERINSPIDVSIVVATRDRGELLDDMLTSLKGAIEGISYEVIVIEGGSRDNTHDVLRKHGITQVYDESEYLGPGRHSWSQWYNFGFSRSRGTWAMYASDDIVFEKGSVAKAINLLKSQKSPSVAGGVFFYKEVIPEYPGWEKQGICFALGHKLLMNFGLIRLDAFRELGGFDEHYVFRCADIDLSFKVYGSGRQLIPLADCLLIHNNVMDELKKKNLKVADTDFQYLLRKWKHFVPSRLDPPKRLFWEPQYTAAFTMSNGLEDVDVGIEHFWHGLACLQIDQPHEAIQCFSQALNSSCKHWTMFWLAAEALYRMGIHDQAQKTADFVARINPGCVEIQPLLKRLKQSHIQLPVDTAHNVGCGPVIHTPRSHFIIEVKYGGIGDHLFYSHLPRIAKQSGKYDRVYVSNHSEFRNPEYRKLVWQCNPYVDGFCDENGTYPLFDSIEEGINILDKIMLLQGLDDGKRFHEPELYFKCQLRPDLFDAVVYDPNYVSYVGDISTIEIESFLRNNHIRVTHQMALWEKHYTLDHTNTILQTDTLEEFCRIIISCRQLLCLSSGTATLAAAFGKPAVVFYGNGQKPMFHHSRLHRYINCSAQQTSILNGGSRILSQESRSRIDMDLAQTH